MVHTEPPTIDANTRGFPPCSLRATRAMLAVAILLLAPKALFAQSVFSSGSTGADGALEFFAAPPRRTEFALAYDAKRQVTVLFGGTLSNGQPTNETWEWNGVRWTARPFAQAPSARRGASIAYDSDRELIVLFGGRDAAGGILGDTWEYNGTAWTLRTLTASPPGRWGAASTYDDARNELVMHGGIVANSGQVDETWVWNGAAAGWVRRMVPAIADFQHSMVYDPVKQVVVMLNNTSTTREWNGTQWSAAINHASIGDIRLIYSPVAGAVLGWSSTGLYRREGTAWIQIAQFSDQGNSGKNAAFDIARSRAVLASASNLSSEWLFTNLWDGTATAFQRPPQSGPLPIIDMAAKPGGVWNYTTITIPEGVELTFKPNAANTPIVWLASGAVRIDGTITLDGSDGYTGSVDPGSEPQGGPGGFRGGRGGRNRTVSGSYVAYPGEGPGGGGPGVAQGEYGGSAGYRQDGSGVLGGPSYGNVLLQPLLGGSGGGGGASTNSGDGGNGGGGGGAILIASSETIELNGRIRANGGGVGCNQTCGGQGSGGGIRLAANRIRGDGDVQASGGGGGRLRLESFFVEGNNLRNVQTSPPLAVGQTVVAGNIRVTSVHGAVVRNPAGGNTNDPDVVFTAAGPVVVNLTTTGVPQGTTIRVTANSSGQVVTQNSSPTNAAGLASATLTVPPGVGTIQAFAEFVP